MKSGSTKFPGCSRVSRTRPRMLSEMRLRVGLWVKSKDSVDETGSLKFMVKSGGHSMGNAVILQPQTRPNGCLARQRYFVLFFDDLGIIRDQSAGRLSLTRCQ